MTENITPFESQEQITFVQWFRMQFPKVLIYAIPNGGMRNKFEATRMKREGIVPGVPDLHIPQWKLWIEMKRQQGGTVSGEQKDIIQHLETIGHEVIIGKGATDAIRKVMKFYEQNTI